MTPPLPSDQEFIATLRAAVERYFAAVDQWESAWRRYYRMPGGSRPSTDLTAEQHEFEACRRELENLLPRARALCFRYNQPDVFAGLPWAALGYHAPQQRTDSAISRSERGATMACLIELSAACVERAANSRRDVQHPVARPSLLDRIAALFD